MISFLFAHPSVRAFGAAAECSRTLPSALATLIPERSPWQMNTVSLPFKWDQSFPAETGIAIYRLELPATAECKMPLGVVLEGVGNQAEIWVDHALVLKLGSLGDPGHNAVIEGNTVAIPPAASRPDLPRHLMIVTTAQRQRGAGLASVRVGPIEALETNHELRQQWSRIAPLVYVVSLLLMGGLAAGLWLRQGDALYRCFCLAAFTGVPRSTDRAWTDIPIPWTTWSFIVAVCYTLHIALIAQFVLLVLDRFSSAMMKALYVLMAIAVALAGLSFVLALPMLWSLGLLALLLFSMRCVPVVFKVAMHDHEPVAWVLLVAGVFALAAGTHDLLFFRMGLFGGATKTYTEHAMFLFVLFLGGLVVERYSRTAKDYRKLNANLAAEVSQKERQLRSAFDALHRQQQAQAILLERQRMMREIHDGVGSQLVGLLNVVAVNKPSHPAIVEHVEGALDEMRMAVDSLQPAHDNLGLVLATLRYRLRARLEAAGLELVWDVDRLQSNIPLSPQEALQLQRILLEAFTNVLKHAKARHVVLRAECGPANPTTLRIEVADDGIGMRTATEAGCANSVGLSSMEERARSIGATLSIGRAVEGGTAVTLQWPIDNPAVTP